MRCQRGQRIREECSFIGNEAVTIEPTARYKLQQIASSTQIPEGHYTGFTMDNTKGQILHSWQPIKLVF